MTKGRLSACIGMLEPMRLEDALEMLARHGFEGVELLGEPDHYKASRLTRLLENVGLQVTALTAASRLPTGRDLSHPDPLVRRQTVEHLRRCIDFGHEIGAGVVGVAPGAVGRYWLASERGIERGYVVDGLAALAEDARAAGVVLGVEVLNRYVGALIHRLRDGVELVAEIGPVAGVVLDLFHAAIEEPDLVRAITEAGTWIVNVQLADNTREGVGRGSLDFDAVLSALASVGYRGPLALEASPPAHNPFTSITEAELPLTQMYVREYVPFMTACLARCPPRYHRQPDEAHIDSVRARAVPGGSE